MNKSFVEKYRAGKMTFADIPGRYARCKSAAAVIVPVPYDETSTWIKGADKGPEALLAAAANMETYDIETGSEIYKVGVYLEKPVTEKSSPDAMVAAVKAVVKKHLNKGKFPILLGGEHSVSIGAFRAVAEKFKNLTILQLDAHGDLRPEYHGTKFNHACVMSRAMELADIVQVGIRSMCIEEQGRYDPARMFMAEHIHDSTAWYDRAISLMNKNVYITIDLDVFDPSIMPGTGTPEPGGLGWYQVIRFLRAVFEQRNVVGCDVVELCPNLASAPSEFLAAKLVYKLLTYKFKN